MSRGNNYAKFFFRIDGLKSNFNSLKWATQLMTHSFLDILVLFRHTCETALILMIAFLCLWT